ncbi:Fungus-induced protein 3 [Caenorhabditis elegans]|uniref:Fungus-induced protein 3 n=1 Tax=Caenorhabditis elegans TaxID=6239 RepID=FIP3_CAEEL|nr:Fungus-induced protein 3 [Caenorhabditis elegans]P34300.1 RecName: Full=Fungus-induced protein 3 [Caenorhabditis elegans]CCD62565.1 Fungus-induced protein 3 [Caenorhabditis elegans]|eukprot:NP_498888.1 Fungus-induced protein 3 [Caenorhabditis elegans]
MNVYSVFIFAILAISSASGIFLPGGGGKKCGGYGGGYGSGVIIGAERPKK